MHPAYLQAASGISASIQSHMLCCQHPLRGKVLTKGRTADRVSFGAGLLRPQAPCSKQADNIAACGACRGSPGPVIYVPLFLVCHLTNCSQKNERQLRHFWGGVTELDMRVRVRQASLPLVEQGQGFRMKCSMQTRDGILTSSMGCLDWHSSLKQNRSEVADDITSQIFKCVTVCPLN